MTSTESGGVVATYLLLRKAIGWIGTLLPIVVIVGDAAFSSGPLPNSLSDFYYTPMRNILVGSLCVLGVFLMLYDVSVRFDRWVTNAAGVGALGACRRTSCHLALPLIGCGLAEGAGRPAGPPRL